MSTSSPPPPLPEFGVTDNIMDIQVSDNVLSYKGNVMMAAIISLLLVILFVLMLHIYAKYVWFRLREPPARSVPSPPGHHHHLNSAANDATHAKGLESSAISSIPTFKYNDGVVGECAICLSVFDAGDLCRKLPGCGHAFHVECIDTWFHSHSTCPICRCTLVLSENNKDADQEVHLEIIVDGGNTEASSSSAPSSESTRRPERKIHPSQALVMVLM